MIFLGVNVGIKYNIFYQPPPNKYKKMVLLSNDFLSLIFMNYMARLSLTLILMQLQFKKHALATEVLIYFISVALLLTLLATAILLILKITKTLKLSVGG